MGRAKNDDDEIRTFEGVVGISQSSTGAVNPDYVKHVPETPNWDPADYDISYAYCADQTKAYTYRVLAIGLWNTYTPTMITATHYPAAC